MPFIEEADSFAARIHVSHMPVLARIGIAALAFAVIALVAGNVVEAMTQPTLSLVSSSVRARQSSLSGVEAASSASLQVAHDLSAPKNVFVHVSGSVAVPGVYELCEGSRVMDAVQAAGGFTEDASQGAVNLARILQDGEQVAIPAVGQETHLGFEADERLFAADGAVTGLVNINTSTQAELETLPGIGPATAAKIVKSRESEGLFSSPEDLKRVAGIGDKKYESIVDLICV